MKKLAESLKQIRTKSESYHTMGIDAGVSAKTIATIVKYPERSYSTRTLEKIKEYISRTENKPEPLSVQSINLLQSQNERLKEQNKELQEENRKLREEIEKLEEQKAELRHSDRQGRKIAEQDIEKFKEIEELCQLAKYKGGDDIYYDDILDVIAKWIY